jgi:hypothetical protein
MYMQHGIIHQTWEECREVAEDRHETKGRTHTSREL